MTTFSNADAAVVDAKEKISYRLLLLTLEKAREIAANNQLSFEALSPRDRARVVAYARAMRTGRWIINGDAIIMAEHGVELLDGKLRILAAIHGETCFPTFMVVGVAKRAAVTIDTHRKRTAAANLYVSGRDNANDLSSAVLTATAMAASGRADRHHGIPDGMVTDFVIDHPSIADAVETMQDTSFAKSVGRGLAGAFKFLADIADEGVSAAFFEDIDNAMRGKDSSSNAKRFAAELIASDDRSSMDGSTARRHRARCLVLLWNAAIDGRALTGFEYDSANAVAMRGVHQGIFDAYRADAPPQEDEDLDVAALYARNIAESPAFLQIHAADGAFARDLLARNGPEFLEIKRNRRVSQPALDKLARDMASNNWVVNGQTIKISINHRLIDGQHRLLALLKAGVSVPLLVATGIDQSAFATLDMGSSRPFADHLRAHGVRNHNEIQGALRIVWQFDRNLLGNGGAMTNSEMLDAWNAYEGIEACATSSNLLRSKINRYIAIGMLYVLSRIDEEDAKRFFRSLAVENVDRDDPINALANALYDLAVEKRGMVHERTRIALICKAWNLWRRGERIHDLVVDPEAPLAAIDVPRSRID